VSQTYSFPITLASETPNTAWSKLNDSIDAVATLFEGTSAPSTTYASQLWHDTSSNILYIRNQADSGWVTLFSDTTSTSGGLVLASAGAFTTLAPTSAIAATTATHLVRKNEVDAAIYTTTVNIGGTSTGNFFIFGAPAAHVISSIKIISDTGTAASDGTNNHHFTVANLTQGNDLHSVAGGKGTDDTEITADTVYDLGVDQNLTMAAGDVLELQVVDNGTGGGDLSAAKIVCIVNYKISY